MSDATPVATESAPLTPTSVSEISNYSMEEFAKFANIPQEAEASSEASTDLSVNEIGAQAAREAALGEQDGVPEYEEGISADEFAEREAAEGEIPANEETSEAQQDDRYITPKVVDRPLATEFTVSSEDGEIEVPDLNITYKVAGKDVTDPIDVVVRKAQQGGYNEALQHEVHTLRSQMPHLQQQYQTLEQENTALLQEVRDMLTDPNRYLAEYEAYQQQHTPESQLQAANRRIQEMEQARLTETETQHASAFSAQLLPKLEAVSVQHPEVTFDEAFGRFNMLIAPLMVQGRIPPQRFAQVAQIVDAQLLPWVEATAETRRTAITHAHAAATKPLAEKASTATAVAQAAKRQVTRALKPQGSASPSTPKPAVYTTATDIMKDIGKIATAGIA